MSHPRLALVGDLLLTRDPAQRVRLSQAGLALALMSVSVAVMQYAVAVAEAPRAPVFWWNLLSWGGLLGFYLLIRSGATRGLADPALTVPQMIYAITSAAAGYALAGPVRGTVFPILAVILMFGMFRLQARGALWVSLYALLLFGLVMGLMARNRPAVYAPAVELGHFMMLAFMLPTVALLAGRLSRIRQRLAAQKQELLQALDKIQTMATRDDLTGLLNRRRMQELLAQELLRSGRSGRGFCLALLDLDHFKRINDSHGHGAGDAVLCGFAAAALGAIRSADVLARWGGEEFVLLLTETGLPAARAGAERLRARVEGISIPLGQRPLGITVSIGLTEYREGETLAQLLERADLLLYEAKAQGRNRVEVG
jgi:diguanylate cyclase (GGDEF)-like protein